MRWTPHQRRECNGRTNLANWRGHRLAATRASLLSEWETMIAYSWEAIGTLQEDRFDLVIISQSVPVERTQEFIRVASASDATPQVPAIQDPGRRTIRRTDSRVDDGGGRRGWGGGSRRCFPRESVAFSRLRPGHAEFRGRISYKYTALRMRRGSFQFGGYNDRPDWPLSSTPSPAHLHFCLILAIRTVKWAARHDE